MEKFGKPRGVYFDTCQKDQLFIKAYKHDKVPIDVNWFKSLNTNSTHQCHTTKINGFDRLFMAAKSPDSQLQVNVAAQPWLWATQYTVYVLLVVAYFTTIATYRMYKVCTSKGPDPKQNSQNGEGEDFDEIAGTDKTVKMEDVKWANITDIRHTYCFKVSYLTGNMVFHLFNLYSDFEYIGEVPMYSTFLQVMMYICYWLPFVLAIVYLAVDLYKKSGADFGKKVNIIISGLIGATDLIEFLQTNKIDYQDEMKIKKEFAYMVLQDIPQLTLQLLNTLLIGQVLTWIQVISPLFSIFCLLSRAPKLHKAPK